MSKRQRHVFPNREIPHLWAHQTQEEARNRTGSFYFHGATIYSYGSHFPIATHVKGSQGQPGILFTSEKNSVTTSQHMKFVQNDMKVVSKLTLVQIRIWDFEAKKAEHLIA